MTVRETFNKTTAKTESHKTRHRTCQYFQKKNLRLSKLTIWNSHIVLKADRMSMCDVISVILTDTLPTALRSPVNYFD